MLKVIISFDGTGYFGWQIQNVDTITVQGEFNKALEKIYKTKVKTIGSGRTDAGVHSLQHHVVFNPPFDIPKSSLIKALNSNLPDNIRATECKSVNDGFRPTNDALRKEYQYFFTNSSIATPISRLYMTNVRYKLDFEMISKACELFVGEHDFKSFHCLGSEPNSTVRIIEKCELVKYGSVIAGAIPVHYGIRIVGNGFLKQMVRLIVGAIWDVGRGKLSLEDIEIGLAKADGNHIAPVAPPQGLFKISVDYSD